jgi:hypothetical protein
VPLPLHVFLGLAHRIIGIVFKRAFGEQKWATAVGSIKQTHSPGCGGKADVFSLNGQEVKQWLERDCTQQLIDHPDPPVEPAILETAPVLTRWLRDLSGFLLSKAVMT